MKATKTFRNKIIMEIITITKENLAQEHICCAIASNKSIMVATKKAWIEARLDDGLMFKKGDVRGKCFIEYIPAEKAWAPINAEGYMYINCLWVSGQFKGHGNANLLLDECIRDSKAKEKKGLVILSSNKNTAFLADPKFLKHKKFLLADEAEPFFQLMYLPFDASDKNAAKPKFMPQVKSQQTSENDKGVTVYYTHQCPFTSKYVPLIEIVANEMNIPFRSILIESAEQAQSSPTPFTTYSVFNDGKFITHEILSEPKFIKMVGTLGYKR